MLNCDSTLGSSAPVRFAPLAISAFDPDGAANTNFSYSLNMSSPSTSAFAVNPDTGTVSVVQSLDTDVNKVFQYTLILRVADQDDLADLFTVNVTVVDVNDNSPVPQQLLYEGTVLENSPSGTMVSISPAIVFTDADSGSNAELTYTLSPSTITSDFTLASSTSTIISTSKMFDYETSPNVFSFSIRAVDGGASPLTGNASVTVRVVDINDNRPVVTGNLVAGAQFVEGGSAVRVADISVSDADTDAFPIQYGVIRIDDTLDDDELLGVSTSLPIGFRMDRVNSSLVIVGEGTTAEYATILSSITYSNPSEELSGTQRTISYFVSDIAIDIGSGITEAETLTFIDNAEDNSNSSVSFTLNLIPVNDQPELVCAQGRLSLNSIQEDIPDATNVGQSVQQIFGSSVSDNDNTASLLGAAAIGFTGQGTWQYRSPSGSFTSLPSVSPSSALLLGPAYVIRFVPAASTVGSAEITLRAWDMTDGLSVGASSIDTTAASTTPSSAFSAASCNAVVEILPENDIPFIDLNSGGPDSPNYRTSYTENQQTLVPVSGVTSVVVSDIDHEYLQSLTVSISKLDGSCNLPSYPYNYSLDILHSPNMTSFSIDETLTLVDKACRTYTYTANLTVANWQWFIAMLRFSIENPEPSDHTRRLEFVISDGVDTSDPVFTNVSVMLVSDNCPEVALSINTPVMYPERASPVVIDSQLVVTDDDYLAELTGATVTITTSDSCDTCQLQATAPPASPISVSYSNGVLVLSGSATPDQYQQVLRTVTFQDTGSEPSFSSTINLRFTALDTTGSCPQGDDITVMLVPSDDHPPVISLDGANVNYSTSFTEGAGGVAVTGNDLQLSDADTVDSDSYNISVAFSAGFVATEDEIVVDGSLSSSVTVISQSSSAIILQGTLATLTTAVKQLRYRNTNNANPSTVQRVLRFRVYVLGNLPEATEAYTTIGIVSVNDPPSITLAPGEGTTDVFVMFEVAGSPVVIAAKGVSISDPDDSSLTQVVLRLEELDTNGMVIPRNDIEQLLPSSINSNGITGSYMEATGLMTLSGSSSISNYEAVLASIRYQNTNPTPSLNNRRITITVYDESLNDSAISTIMFGDLPQNPVVDLNGPVSGNNVQATFLTKGSPLTLTPNAVVTDPDSDNILKADVVYSGPAATCQMPGLSFSNSFADISIDSNTVGTSTEYNITTSFSQGRQSAIFDNIFRGMSFFVSDSAATGMCTVTVQVTDVRNGVSNVAMVTISVVRGNDPPLVDLDLGRPGRDYTREYLQGIDTVVHIASILNASVAMNLTTLTPVGEAPGEAAVDDESGLVVITDQSNAGYSLTDSDNTVLEYLSARFIYASTGELIGDAIRYPCIPNNSSLVIDPRGCTVAGQVLTYSDFKCDPNLFNACNNPIDLCTNLQVRIACGSKDYRFSYQNNAGTVARFSELLGNLGYERLSALGNTSLSRTLTINVTVSDGQALSSPALTLVQLTSGDTLIFQQNNFSMYENERPSRGFVFYKADVRLRNGSRPVDGSTEFNIVGGNVGGAFTVDNNGNFRLVNKLDRETVAVYQLSVTSRLIDADPRSATTGTVTVDIIDVNDNRPQVATSYNVSVFENAVGQQVLNIDATDADIGTNAQLVYGPLIGVGSTQFSVNMSTGVLTLTKPLNASRLDYILLVLIISDQGNPIYLSTHTMINIYVLPTPPDSLQFNLVISDTDIAVQENITTNSVIGRVQAFEVGTGDTNTVRYRIDSTEPMAAFSVDTITGILRTVSLLSAEDVSQFKLVVEAFSIRTDITVMSALLNVTITVTDINEFAPNFVGAPYSVAIPEDTNIGATILTVTATDPDQVSNPIIFSLPSPPPGLPFTVLSNGSVLVSGQLDADTITSYNFVVQAQEDLPFPMMATADVTISITDVNDEPPVFTNLPYLASVRETAPNQTAVQQLSSSDADILAVNRDVYYELDDEDTPFCINGNNLVVCNPAMLTSVEEPNFEYNLSITAVNAAPTGNQNSSTTAIVSLILINEFSPVFATQQTGSTPVRSEQPNCPNINPLAGEQGDVLFDYSTNDADGGINGVSTFSLQESNVPFAVNAVTGELIINATCLDVDAFGREFFDLTVVAEDGADLDGTVFNASTIYRIRIVDVNDNPPIILNPLTINVLESETTVGNVFYTIMVRDDDVIAKQTSLEFRLESTAGEQSWTIGCDTNTLGTVVLQPLQIAQNGDLSFCVEQDFEAGPRTRRIEMRLRNPGGFSFSSSGTEITFTQERIYNITINLVDSNEHRPVVNGDNFTFSVPENEMNQTLVGVFTASDVDAIDSPNGQVQFYISTIMAERVDSSCTPNLPFYITASGVNMGELRTCQPLNFELAEEYNFFVSACDLGNFSLCSNSTKPVKVTVIDRNDNPPVFDMPVYSASIPEDTAVGVNVTTLTVTDMDSDPNSVVFFTLEPFGSPFILQSTGLVATIRVNQPFDYEMGSREYVLRVNATNSALDATQRASVFVYINITDVNDNSPIVNGPVVFSVEEEVPAMTVVGEVVATDADSGSNALLTYNATLSSSTASNDCSNNALFSIGLNSGEISTCRPLDYEEDNSMYQFQIEVCDSAQVRRCILSTITVNVMDINDNPPVFPNASISLDVQENSPPNLLLDVITTTDADSLANSDVLYTLNASNAPFGIRNNDELYYTGASPLDFESSTKYYVLMLTATNEPNNTNYVTQNATAIVNITVIDRNDNPPLFPQDSANATIQEHATTGSLLYLLSTTDADSAENSAVSYEITTSDSPFSISDNMVVVESSAGLDLEDLKSPYFVDVVAINAPAAADDVTNTANFTVRVTITDINDNTPRFVSPLGIVTAEDFPVNLEVSRVRAKDADTGLNAEVRFSLEGGSACQCGGGCIEENFSSGSGDGSGSGIGDTRCTPIVPFELSPIGNLDLCRPLDYEQYCMYVLTVTACDRGTPQLCNTTDITISVMDINDNEPVIVGQTMFTVRENATIGEEVGCVNATDADSGMNANVAFSLVSSEELPFNIVSNSGCIRVNSSLDHEADMTHTFTVVATDGGNPALSSSATITVHVTNVNDHPPVFTSNTTASVSENEINAFVIQVTTTDSDVAPFNSMTYSLQNNPGGRFNITSAGEIRTAVPLNRETNPLFTVVVAASDGAFTVTQAILISVLDKNDNAPVYVGPLQFNETENTNFTLFVDFVDADIGMNSDLVFSVNDSRFSFINNTRWLRNNQVLDRDPGTGGSPVLVLSVTATDQGLPAMSTSMDITVVLADENDNAPYPLPPFNITVRDSTPLGVLVATLNAADDDEGINAEVVFSFAVPDSSFFINSTTGEVTVAGPITLDGDTAMSGNLSIRITNLDRSTDYIVILYIVDLLPIFNPDNYIFSVTENDFSASIGQVTAIDRDFNASNDRFFFQVLSSSPYGGFSFVNNSLISPAQYLDYEDTSVFMLVIGVGNGEMVFDNATVTVHVNDTNDNPPLLSPLNITVTIMENIQNGSIVLKAVGLDFDSGMNGQLDYALLSGDGRENFMFDSEGNLLLVNSAAIDHETVSSYQFVFRACDEGVSSRCSVPGTIAINVSDVDDIPPRFTQTGPLVETISETLEAGRSILAVTVVDNDTPLTDVTLTLVPPQTLFAIEQVTGILRTTSIPLDHEQSPSHTFLIRATDTAGTSASISVTINLDDEDDNRPEVLPFSSTVIFPEEGEPVDISHLTISDADPLSENEIQSATVALHRTPTAMEPFPATGGFCDHANFTTLYQQNSFGMCGVTGCRSIIDSLTPILNATIDDRIVNLPTINAQARNKQTQPGSTIASVLGSELVNFTFSFWVRLPQLAQPGHIVEIDASGVGFVFILRAATDSRLEVVVGTTVILATSATGILDNQYHHLSVVRNGPNLVIFVDGVSAAANTNGNEINSGFTGRGFMFFGRELIGFISEIYFCPSPTSQDDVRCVTTCGDKLSVDLSTSDVTAAVNHRTRTVSLQCVGTGCSLGVFNAALDNITYKSVLDEPHPLDRGLFVVAEDAVGPGNHSVVTLRPSFLNDKLPVLDLNGAATGIDYSTTFTELSAAIPIVPDYSSVSSELVLYDLDSGYSTINRLVITIQNGTSSTEQLSVTQLPEGIQAEIGNGGTTLTLRSSDSTVERFPDLYVAALGAVRYQNTQQDPGAQQIIRFTVYDAGGMHTNNPIASTVILIQPRNDPPVLDLNAGGSGIDTTVAFKEANNREVTLLADADVTVVDPDNTFLMRARFNLINPLNGPDVEFLLLDSSSLSGTLAATGTTTLVVTGNASISDYIQVLKNVKYRNTNNNPSTDERTVTVTITDDGGAVSEQSARITITIERHNDPVEVFLGGPGSTNYLVDFVEDRDKCVSIANTSVILHDPENAGINSAILQQQGVKTSDETLMREGNIPQILLSFELGNDQLLLFSINKSSAVFEAGLPYFMYCNSAEEPVPGVRMVSVSVADIGLASEGGGMTTTVFAHVNIIGVNDLPQLNITGDDSLSVRNEPTPIIDGDTITLEDNDNTTFDEIIITIVNPQDTEFNELIQFVGNLPANAQSVGPSVDSSGAITYTVTLVNASTNITVQAIREIRYNNNAANITTKPDRQICIRVRDGVDFSVPACVNVTISEPNDFTPQFTNNLASLNITQQETSSPLSLLTLTAVDNDQDPLASFITFSIFEVNSVTPSGTTVTGSTAFVVDSMSSELTAPQGLDAENFLSHNVTVRASDRGNPNRFSFASVLVTVLDINDVAPQFNGAPFLFDDATINREGLAPPRVITTFTATDGDATSPNNVIVGFNLENNFNGLFNLTSTGMLSFVGDLDAEVQREYVLNVSVRDNGSPSLTTYTSVTIDIVDVNDNAAEINQLAPAVYVTESNQSAQSIGPAIRVVDADEIAFIGNLMLQVENPEGTRPYINCLGLCQNQRLASAGLLTSTTINLIENATFEESFVGFSRLQIGPGACDAIRLQRTESTNFLQDGIGRIPRSQLPSDFASGEFTVSVVLNITNEGFLVIVTNSTDPNADPSTVERYFNIWVRRRNIRFNYLYGNNQLDVLNLNLPGLSSPPITELFNPDTQTYQARHFVFVYSNSPNQITVYMDCEVLGTVALKGALIPFPATASDVFIGRSIPSPLSSPNGGHLGGDLHGLYYFPTALSSQEILSYCFCGRERLLVPSTVPSSINIVNQQDDRISLQPANSQTISVDDLQTFLRSVDYENTFRPPTIDAQKRLSFSVSDVEFTTDGQTSNTDGFIEFVTTDTNIPVVDLNGVAASGINYSTSFTEDVEPVAVTSTLVLITRDNNAAALPTFSSITVQLTNGVDSGEYLIGTSGANIKVSGSQTSTLTITGPGLAGEFNTALRDIRYNNENDKPNTAFQRQITFTVTDTEGRVNSPLAVALVTIIPTNDAPHLALSSQNGDEVHTVTFTEKGAPVLLAPNTTVSDVDSDLLQSAEVRITKNFVTEEDILNVTTPSSITFNYNSVTGVLTLTGAAPLAEYQTTLRNLQFSSTANPQLDNEGQPVNSLEREVVIIVSDGNLTSQSVTVAVNFIPVDDAPVINLNGSSSLNFTDEDSPLRVFPKAYIEDPDNTVLRSLRVTLLNSADGDLLNDGVTQSSILSYTMDNSINTVAQFTAILRNISYVNNAPEPTLAPRTVLAEVSDFRNITMVAVNIDIKDLNDNPPQFEQTNYQFDVAENEPSGTTVGMIQATDVDRDMNTISFTLLSHDQDFSLTPTSSLSPADVSIVTDRMFDFESTPNVFIVQVQASDGELSSTTTVQVTVTNKNEPPLITLSDSTILAAADQSRPLFQSIQITIMDVDDGDSVTNGTLTLSEVPVGSDESLALNQSLPGYSFNQTSPGFYVLTNTGSSLSFNEALQYVYYVAGTEIEDSSSLRTVSLVVFDSYSLPSSPAIIMVSLADIPEFINTEQYTATLVEGQSYANFLQVTATVESGGDIIKYFVEDNFGVSIDADNGSLTLFEPLNFEKTGPIVSFEVYAVDTLAPPRTGTATVTINVVDSNDVTPMANITAGVVIQSNTPTVLIGDIIISDPDQSDLVGASVTMNGSPLMPSPFSGRVCVDEGNAITKYATTCGLTDFTQLITSSTNYSGAAIESDMYDNSILSNDGSGYSLVNANFSQFSGTISQFTLAFWLQPTADESGYVVFFSNTAGTERYLAVFLDGSENQLIVTLKQKDVPGLMGQVRIVFQLPDTITDGSYHFIMLQYLNRMVSCSVDGTTVPNMAVTYKNLIGQVFGELN